MATAADRARAEAKKSAGEFDTVPLGGQDLQVLPPMDWRSSAIEALSNNNYEVWARGCLTPASYAAWQRIDPTLRQCEEFFSAWKGRTGQDAGESAAS